MGVRTVGRGARAPARVAGVASRQPEATESGAQQEEEEEGETAGGAGHDAGNVERCGKRDQMAEDCAGRCRGAILRSVGTLPHLDSGCNFACGTGCSACSSPCASR